LDGELLDALHGQLERARAATRACARATTSTTGRGRWFDAREVRLALDCALFACTTGANKPTPGQALMNLRLRDERGDGNAVTAMKSGVEGPGLSVAQRVAYGLAKCVVGYGWGAWQTKMLRERYDEAADGDGAWK
jgi:peroxin-2